jgi:hypothetical protein
MRNPAAATGRTHPFKLRLAARGVSSRSYAETAAATGRTHPFKLRLAARWVSSRNATTAIPLFLLGLLVFAPPAGAGTDTAADFVRCLQKADYAAAYQLMSDAFKAVTRFEEFEREQIGARIQYELRFGTAKILRAEEWVLRQEKTELSVRDQLTLGELDLSKLFFWNWWKPREKRRVFQFVFEGDKKILFGVDTLKVRGRNVVTRYEFLPKLQQALEKRHPGISVQQVKVIG